MAVSNEQFRIHAIFYCIILFIVLSFAHIIAISLGNYFEVQSIDNHLDELSTQASTINASMGNNFRLVLQNITNETNSLNDQLKHIQNFDASSVLFGLASVFIGLELPFPFPIFVGIFNLFLFGYVAYCVMEIVRTFIPLLPGD